MSKDKGWLENYHESLLEKEARGEKLTWMERNSMKMRDKAQKARKEQDEAFEKFETTGMVFEVTVNPNKYGTDENIETLTKMVKEEKEQREAKKGTLWYHMGVGYQNFCKNLGLNSKSNAENALEKALKAREKKISNGTYKASNTSNLVEEQPIEISRGRTPIREGNKGDNMTAEIGEVPIAPANQEKTPYDIKGGDKEKESFSVVFVGGGGIFGVSLCVFLLCALLSLVPIINLLALPLGFIAGCAMLFVAPLVMLRDFLRWTSGTRVIPTDKQFQETLEGYAVEGRKKQIQREEAEKEAAAHIDELARKQLEEKEEETLRKKREEEEARIEAVKTTKVDLGFGKKVKFDDLPTNLQEQLLQAAREEPREE